MTSRYPILFFTCIILISSSCSSNNEPVPVTSYLYRSTKINIEGGSTSSPKVVETTSQIYLGIKLGGLFKEYNETMQSLVKTGRLRVLDNGVGYELNKYKNQSYILVPVVTTKNEPINEVQFLVADEKKNIGVLIQDFKTNNYNMNIPLNQKVKIRAGIIEKLSTMYGLPKSIDTIKSKLGGFGEMIEIKNIWRTPDEQIYFTESYFGAELGLKESFSSMYITFKRNSL